MSSIVPNPIQLSLPFDAFELRVCSSCGLARPMMRFKHYYIDGQYRYTNPCKDCINARKRAQRTRRVIRYPDAPTTCITCGRSDVKFGRQKRMLSGYNRECQSCCNLRILLKRYTLTKEQADALFVQQNGQCLICGRSLEPFPAKKTHIDHSHSNGTVRGFLCHWCNCGLGNFRDDPALLRAAAAYLEGRDNDGAT